MTETEIETIIETEIETVIGITTGGMIEAMTEKEAMTEDMTGTGVTTGETVTIETGKRCSSVLLLIGEAVKLLSLNREKVCCSTRVQQKMIKQKIKKTRLQSSRMSTTRLLTVSRSIHIPEGEGWGLSKYLGGGVCLNI